MRHWRQLIALALFLTVGLVAGLQSPAGAPEAEPPEPVRFVLDVQGVGVFSFSRCAGIGSETEVIQVADPDISNVPGATRPLQLSCLRGYTADLTLAAWREAIVEGSGNPTAARLAMIDSTGDEIGSWTYIDIWPQSLVLQTDSSSLPFEVVTFVADNVFLS